MCLALVWSAAGCYASHLLPERAADAGVVQDAANRTDGAPRDRAIADAAPTDAVFVPDASEPPIEEDLTGLVEAYCRRQEECAGPRLYTNVDDCIEDSQTLYLALLAPLWKNGLSDDALEYHPERIAACIDSTRTASCDSFVGANWLCDIFTGLRGTGEPCITDEECADDGYCPTWERVPSCGATCEPRGPEGAPCRRSSCQRGLRCDHDNGCVPVVGESCRGPTCSAYDLTCLGDSATEDGVCRPRAEAFQLPVGARCDPDLEDYCMPPASCALVSGRSGEADAVHRCESPYSASAPCHAGFPDGCPHDQYCLVDPGAPGEVGGVCTPLPGLDMPCAPGDDRAAWTNRCRAGLVCDLVSCQVRVSVGDSCGSPTQCSTFDCEDGVCVVPECMYLH